MTQMTFAEIQSPAKTECERLLKHFKAGGTLTSFEAYAKFGITQLGRCISDLERAGYRFKRPRVKINDKIVCRYSLEN